VSVDEIHQPSGDRRKGADQSNFWNFSCEIPNASANAFRSPTLNLPQSAFRFLNRSFVILSTRAWMLLCGSVAMLAGGLLLCLFGRELMLKMLENNSVNFGLVSLKYSRWAAYGCVFLAAIMVGFFTIEVAVTSKLPENGE